MSVNESFYDKKVGATQTDPDLALRHKHGLFSAEPQRAYEKVRFQPETYLNACLISLNKKNRNSIN